MKSIQRQQIYVSSPQRLLLIKFISHVIVVDFIEITFKKEVRTPRTFEQKLKNNESENTVYKKENFGLHPKSTDERKLLTLSLSCTPDTPDVVFLQV